MLDFFWNAPFVILQLIFVILFWSGIIFGGYTLGKDLLDRYIDRRYKLVEDNSEGDSELAFFECNPDISIIIEIILLNKKK